MIAFGHSLAQILETGDVLALDGGLGAGKSTLARGIICGVLQQLGLPAEDIPSPTFTLVQSYPWPNGDDHEREVWHMDLWRLDGPDDIIELGFDEALGRHAMIIEWPDRLGELLPPDALLLSITTPADASPADASTRSVCITARDDGAWPERLAGLVIA